MLGPPVLLAIAANLLLIVAPPALNVAVDMATDRQHAEKGYLAGAAGRGLAGSIAFGVASMDCPACSGIPPSQPRYPPRCG